MGTTTPGTTRMGRSTAARRTLAATRSVITLGASIDAATARHRRTALGGRDNECDVLDSLVAEARVARSQVLVLRGEPGIGKTALLDYLAESAVGFLVARTVGVESEVELAFAGLHQLCGPMLDYVDRIPGPQRDALATAFGFSDGSPPDHFLVGLAVLSLLAEVAEDQPVVCLIDGAQWLDQVSMQTLSFVARRLLAEPVALVFATRGADEDPTLGGLRELVVRGLSVTDARRLLESQLLGPLDAAVRDGIVAETRGNPLALLELPRGLTPAELAGGFGLPAAFSVEGRLDETFQRLLAKLPDETRRLLLVASADPVGEPGLLWRAATQLGIGFAAADPVVATGLLEIGGRVRFRHPLIRSLVYSSALPQQRRDVHRALAEATDAETDPDRRAWHRARAVAGTDEAAAVQLERSADQARQRGGAAAAAAFLTRAMELTLDQRRRGTRALAAARATMEVGAPEAADELLAAAERSPLGDFERAELQRLRAELAFMLTQGSETPPLLLSAAQRLEPLDIALAREVHLEALSAAQFAGRLAADVGVHEAAEAALAAPSPSAAPRPCDLLLDGLARRLISGPVAGAALSKLALDAFRKPEGAPQDRLRWLWLASTTASDLWDDEAWGMLAARHVQLARDTGTLAVLPLALSSRVAVHIFAGEFAAAASLIDEAKIVIDATGGHLGPYGALMLAAWQGREQQTFELIAETVREAERRGEGIGLTVVEWAGAVLACGSCRYEDALIAAQRASDHSDELAVSGWALVELIEAASRLGKVDLAIDALRRITATTRASGSDWALGIEARSIALVSESADAERLYREAIERLGRTRVRVELARSHLVYGEWLRRAGRRHDARDQLRAAHEIFTEVGAEAFGERARRELLATGLTVRKRTVETLTDLTAQEAQIARLAAELRTNPEIGVQLFLSPRTVEWHLHKVFTKLGVSSRRELRVALGNTRSAAASA